MIRNRWELIKKGCVPGHVRLRHLAYDAKSNVGLYVAGGTGLDGKYYSITNRFREGII